MARSLRSKDRVRVRLKECGRKARTIAVCASFLVEDEHGIADFVERALRAQGHAVDVAPDGLAGERSAVGGDPDLVIPRRDATRAERP